MQLNKTDDLLREVLETYANMTTEQFSQGADRLIREKIARHLGLNPADYCLWVTENPPTKPKRSRQAREIQRRHTCA